MTALPLGEPGRASDTPDHDQPRRLPVPGPERQRPGLHGHRSSATRPSCSWPASASRNRWQAQVSYVLSKAYGAVDNTSEGSFGANSSTNGGGGTRQYETPNISLVNLNGELTNSRRHEVKLMLGVQVPKVEVGVNAYFRSLSGRPYTPFEQFASSVINFPPTSAGRRVLLEPRGSRAARDARTYWTCVSRRSSRSAAARTASRSTPTSRTRSTPSTITGVQVRVPDLVIGNETVRLRRAHGRHRTAPDDVRRALVVLGRVVRNWAPGARTAPGAFPLEAPMVLAARVLSLLAAAGSGVSWTRDYTQGLRERGGAAAAPAPLLPQRTAAAATVRRTPSSRKARSSTRRGSPPATSCSTTSGRTTRSSRPRDRFSPVVIDGGDQTLQVRYQVVRTPTTLVTDPWGNEILRVSGYYERARMLRLLGAVPTDFAALSEGRQGPAGRPRGLRRAGGRGRVLPGAAPAPGGGAALRPGPQHLALCGCRPGPAPGGDRPRRST